MNTSLCGEVHSTYLKKVSRNTTIWWWVQWDTRPPFTGCLRRLPGQAIFLAALPLLLPLATKVERCLSHFSSHLNGRRWEEKKENIFELKHMYKIRLCYPNRTPPEFSRNNSMPFLPSLFHITIPLPSPVNSLTLSMPRNVVVLPPSQYPLWLSSNSLFFFCSPPSRCLFSAHHQRSSSRI